MPFTHSSFWAGKQCSSLLCIPGTKAEPQDPGSRPGSGSKLQLPVHVTPERWDSSTELLTPTRETWMELPL